MSESRLQFRWRSFTVLLAGACLGYWMFGFRGAALFMVIALLITVAFRLIASYSCGVAAALALGLAAAALHSASTLGWGGADVLDGTRYKASPVGLSHVLSPRQPVSETIDCGWYAASGYSTPCVVAENGHAAFRRLLAVYPVVQGAVLLCLVGAVISFRCGRDAWDHAARRGDSLLLDSQYFVAPGADAHPAAL
jgi:hypothetical protein